MPKLSVWMIRTSLLHLSIGFTLGGLMLFNKGIPVDGWLWALLPLHMEMLLIGWLVQLAMGVAYWILPRFYKYVAREETYSNPRGNIQMAWAAFVLLNAGVLLVGLAGWWGGTGLRIAGRVMESLAALTFALHAWPRIKPAGT